MSEPESKRVIKKIKLTRHQVARREIDAAVVLLLSGGEPVAVNLLAWAAVDVLRGVCQAQGIETFMVRFEERIRPEFHQQWRRALKDHHNFLKHAREDPDRIVDDFRPEASTYPLLVAIEDYWALYSIMTYPMHVFRAWFKARNPHLMSPLMAALFEDAKPVIGDISAMDFDRSTQSAGDVLTSYLNNPRQFAEKLGPYLDTVEW